MYVVMQVYIYMCVCVCVYVYVLLCVIMWMFSPAYFTTYTLSTVTQSITKTCIKMQMKTGQGRFIVSKVFFVRSVVKPRSSPDPPTPFFISCGFLTRVDLQGEGVCLTPNQRLVDQVSVFMFAGDRVVQLHPRTLVIHFSILLRHAWTTLRLLLFPTTTRE